MSDFKFACPHCGQHMQCEEQFSGRQITCPACKVLINIPPVPGKTADYQPQHGMTWNTHVPAGNVPPAPGLRVAPKKAD